MGIYDREYMSDGKRGFGISGWSVVTWLLIINLAAYLIQHFIFNHVTGSAVNFSKDTLFSGQVWRLLTYQFCHSDLRHLLSNMIGLFFIGRMLQQVIDPKFVAPIYLFGGLIGAVAHLIWGFVVGHIPVIGASASVLAVATALVVLIPEQRVSLLFLPFQFKIKYFGWVMLGYNVIGLLFSFMSPSNVAYMAHLGGMAAGWFFIKSIYPNVRFSPSIPGRPKPSKKKRSKIAESAEEEIKRKRDKETIYLNKRVDAILDKISSQGMQSLTAEEKKILERTSKKMERKLDDKS